MMHTINARIQHGPRTEAGPPVQVTLAWTAIICTILKLCSI